MSVTSAPVGEEAVEASAALDLCFPTPPPTSPPAPPPRRSLARKDGSRIFLEAFSRCLPVHGCLPSGFIVS